MRPLRLQTRVTVSSSHWKCAGETGVIVAFDPHKVNKYLVRFDREVIGTLGNRELWLGEPDLVVESRRVTSPKEERPPLTVVYGSRKKSVDKALSAL